MVINPGSVTETWLPDMLVTAAVPNIQITGGLNTCFTVFLHYPCFTR